MLKNRIVRAWIKDGKIYCLSQVCTKECVRYNQCNTYLINDMCLYEKGFVELAAKGIK